MASIHQRPDGRWHISFRLGGTQFKPSLKTTSKTDARASKVLVEETLRLIETGRISLPEKEFRTFAQVWAMARAKRYVLGPSPTKDVKLDLPDEKEPFRNAAAEREVDLSLSHRARPNTIPGTSSQTANGRF